MPDILKISELVEDLSAPRWVEYPQIPGYKLQLRLPDVPESARIMGRAMLKGGLPEGLQAPPAEGDEDAVAARALAAVDWVEHQLQLTLFAVAGWQGLRVEHLAQLLPGRKVKMQSAGGDACATAPDAELSFCPENLEFLVRHSVPFSNWLSKYVRDWDRQVTRQEAKDNENLPPTPDTSPTPSA
ncbi:MAG: hypothetical protein C4567_12440 [Deltaproteobacteria bacterium]|nr:MAG: hypothetical protein C4567_12440 [Deltaproteobacteria bacterium]